MFDTLRCRLMRVIDLKQPQRNALLRANVVHAATCRPGAVAPGQAITIFGAGLGPEEAASADLEGSGRAGTLLGGVRVLFDGVPAPLLYAQSTQVNAVAPFALNPGGSVTVTVEREGTPVGTIALETAEAVPGLFTAGGSGMGPAAALDETGRAVTAENPARRGSVVTLTATGLGRTDPQPEDGAAGSGATVAPLAALAATVGGKQAAVESVCGASGQTAGIVLVSVRVPADTAAGEAVPVVLRAGGAASPDGVTLPLI